MNQQLRTALIGWMARGLSVIAVGSIFLFTIGEHFNPLRLNMQEALLFLFFPLGIVIGMAIGWRREGLGGLITLVSMALFYTVHLIQSGRLPKGPFFLIFALPNGYPHAALIVHPVMSSEMFSTHFRVKDIIICPSENDIWFNDGPIP